MDYKDIIQTEKGALITGLRCFSLPLILDCGQAFRWTENNGEWSGIAHGRELTLRQTDDSLLFVDKDVSEVKEIWVDYFDLNRNYVEICERLSADQHLKEACSSHYGIRLLKQDEWEA